MLWLTLWFLVILKLPALYLCYVIWWSVKDPPQAATGGSAGSGGFDPSPYVFTRVPQPRPRPGPHGSRDGRRNARHARPRTRRSR